MYTNALKASGCVALLLLGILFLTSMRMQSASAAQAPGPAMYSLDVSVVPVNADRKQFTCDVSLRNLANDELLFAPHIGASAGDEASVTGGPEGSGVVYSFSIKVDPSTESAIYMMNVTENKKILFLHRATICLRPKE